MEDEILKAMGDDTPKDLREIRIKSNYNYALPYEDIGQVLDDLFNQIRGIAGKDGPQPGQVYNSDFNLKQKQGAVHIRREYSVKITYFDSYVECEIYRIEKDKKKKEEVKKRDKK